MQWYYDFISPFAYLQSTHLNDFSENESIELKPLLFAGLLNHWNNVGPAEIAPKRSWTFQHIVWLAQRDGIELRLPEYHPFNPLPLLRLSMALNNEIEVVQRLFRFVWVDGLVPQNEEAYANLLSELNITHEATRTDFVKTALHNNGQEAIANGVFGVPTIVRGKQLFWGYDATDMANAHRDKPEAWPSSAMSEIETYREGPARRRRDNNFAAVIMR